MHVLDIFPLISMRNEFYSNILSVDVNSLDDIDTILSNTYSEHEKKYFRLLREELEGGQFVILKDALIPKLTYGPGFCNLAEDYHMRTLFLRDTEKNKSNQHYGDSNMDTGFYNTMAAAISDGQMIGYVKIAGNHTFIATKNIVNESGKVIMPKYALGWPRGDFSYKVLRHYFMDNEICIIEIDKDTPFDVDFSRFFNRMHITNYGYGLDIEAKELDERIARLINDVENGHKNNYFKLN